jgi:uncharacterized protein (TIGR02452 family)
MNYIEVAKDTLNILSKKKYTNLHGQIIDLSSILDYSVKNSKLYKPDSTFDLSNQMINYFPNITVKNISTLQAAEEFGNDDVCVLNFASAKHPGGGFTWGAQAQEETVARASGLYSSLIEFPEFYDDNKRSQSKSIGLYLDYAIYTPICPIFKNDDCQLLPIPYFTSVVTSPAPNRREEESDFDEWVETNNIPDDIASLYYEFMIAIIDDVFYNRMIQVLKIMAKHGHRNIVLGAWGCGVFGNYPDVVADLFKMALKEVPYFDNIVFAIYSKNEYDTNLLAFKEVFG